MSFFGPVVLVPAQEPASKGGWFRSLLDSDEGGIRVSVGWVALQVTAHWDRTRTRFRASAGPAHLS